MARAKARDGYHHGDLRAALIDTARELVETKGPVRLTMSDASRAAGVSTAAPYRHFRDLDALLVAVAEAGLARQHATLAASVRAHAAGSDAAVTAIGVAYVEFALAEPGVFRLLFALTRTVEAPPTLLAAGEAAFGVLLAQLRTRLGPTHSEGAILERGLQLWAFVHGLAFLLLDEKVAAGPPVERRVEFIADVTRRLLAP